MGYIYGLFAKDGELRYVGKTTATLKRRLAQHLTARTLSKNTPKSNWIKKYGRPTIDVIEQVPDSEIDEAERFYIAYFRYIGCRLLNMTPGGDGIPKGYAMPTKGKPRPWAKANGELSRIPVVDERGNEYPSIYHASVALGVSRRAIRNVLCGEWKQAKGHVFNYKEADDE